MIFSRVDLPEPLRPSTPILAPGKKQGDVLQDLPLRRHDLADAVHGVDVLGHGICFCGKPRLSRMTKCPCPAAVCAAAAAARSGLACRRCSSAPPGPPGPGLRRPPGGRPPRAAGRCAQLVQRAARHRMRRAADGREHEQGGVRAAPGELRPHPFALDLDLGPGADAQFLGARRAPASPRPRGLLPRASPGFLGARLALPAAPPRARRRARCRCRARKST
jgi:hypothetical protein